VAFTHDEAVAVGRGGLEGIDAEDTQKKSHQDIGRGQISAGVPESGAVDHLEAAPAQSVCEGGQLGDIGDHALTIFDIA
jgi:hypothetical protein